MDDEDAVLLTDACPTGYFAAELGEIKEGDVVVVFGSGAVGLFAARSSWLMGAGRVIVIDHLEYRLEMARTFAHAETVNFTEVDDIVVHLKKLSEHAGAQPGIVARRCVDRRSSRSVLAAVEELFLSVYMWAIISGWPLHLTSSSSTNIPSGRSRCSLRSRAAASRLRPSI